MKGLHVDTYSPELHPNFTHAQQVGVFLNEGGRELGQEGGSEREGRSDWVSEVSEVSELSEVSEVSEVSE